MVYLRFCVLPRDNQTIESDQSTIGAHYASIDSA